MTTAANPVPSLIYLDEQGRARIQGTRFKVAYIAQSARAGLDVNAIQEAHPDLSRAQIHAALAYYFEHQEAMDAQLEQAEREVAQFIAKHPNPLTREELLRRRPST